MNRQKSRPSGGLEAFNRVSPTTNILFSLLFALLALLCILPVVFVTVISFSSADSITRLGYSFFPDKWSLEAYRFLWDSRKMIGSAFGISILVTAVGTLLGLYLTASMGYVLSRPSYRLRGLLTWMVFIPMIFSGGLVATYNVYTTVLRIHNSVWVLILPLAVSSFNVTICRTFFRTTVPDSVIESARIDGATDYGILFKIVVPLVKPSLATVAILLFQNAWNSMEASSLFINTESLKTFAFYMNSLSNSGNGVAGMGMAAAAALLMFLPNVILFTLMQSRVMSTMAYSGLK